jgi:site-specific DNA recombinase
MGNSKSMANHRCPENNGDDRPKRAGIYARVSSGSQVFGYSLDEQIRLSRERCNMMGWKVCYIFREDGESAGTTDRPKFQAMIEQARWGNLDVLVFWKLDRFCRSLLDVVNVEKQLREWGVNICSLTEAIDTTSSHGRFIFRTIASAAEWERDMIKERSRMGMKALALQHKWPNKIVPLGYNKEDDGFLTINPEEARLVRKIFRMYIKIISMPQVAFELNKKGIRTKKGKRWSKVYIKRILDNELYIGKYNIAGVKAYIKECKIIGEKLFKEAKELRYRYRKENKPMPKTRKEAVVKHVFDEYILFLKDIEKMENTNRTAVI